MRYAKQCNGKFNKVIERQDVINALTNEFYTKDGKSFCNSYTLAKDLMFSIHEKFGLMPNDWVYRTVHALLLESINEWVDDLDTYIDIYTTDLIEWSKQFHDYVDVTLGAGTMVDCISHAQYNVLRDIISIINDFIDDQLGV